MVEWVSHHDSRDMPRGTCLVSMTVDVGLVWDGSRLVYTDGTREIAASRLVRWKAGGTILVERDGHLLRVWVSAEMPLSGRHDG